MHTLSSNELRALVSLLADRSDPVVHAQLLAQLREMDEVSLRALRLAARQGSDYVLMETERVLHAQIWDSLVTEVPIILGQSQTALLDLVVLLARFGHLDCDVAAIHAKLKTLTDECKEAGRTFEGMRDVLAMKHMFRGNDDDYYNPENTYIDSLLKNQSGIPISISALYLLIAQRLDIPLKGVGLPGHFVVGLFTEGEFPKIYDPFNGAAMLSREMCRQIIEGHNIPYTDGTLAPVPERYIFQRMCNNLLHIYQKAGDSARVAVLKRLILAAAP